MSFPWTHQLNVFTPLYMNQINSKPVNTYAREINIFLYRFFRDKIEVPLALISSDLNPSGPLHAFIKTQNTTNKQIPP